MKLKHLDTNIDKQKAWDFYVDQHTNGTIYHKVAWKNIVEKQYNKTTYYLFVEEQVEGKSQLVGLLPLVCFNSKIFGQFIVSFPYVNYGGMLYSNDQAKNLLLEEAKNILSSSGTDSIELRTMNESEFDLPVKSNKVTYYLSLPEDEEALMKQFKAKLRSQIRKPIKEGMTAKVLGLDGLDQFYEIFAYKMRELGTPVYPKSFFKTILKEIPDNANIVLVYSKENIAVAAAFVIFNKGMMEIPWAATLRKYDRLSPNMLLYFEVLKHAMGLKCHTFDFGRCSKDSGTYRFKKQWGGEEKTLHWYYLLKEGDEIPQVNPNNPKYQLAIKIWQKLPLFVTKIIGPLLIKDIP